MHFRASCQAMVIAGAIVVTGCGQAPAGQRHIVPSYDTFTRQLIQLMADQNGDGRIDQVTYLRGNTPLRGEGDVDGDGRIDRWEYFGANGQLTVVGTASRNDGVEDTRTWTAPADGETRIDRSRSRDRVFNRHEFYKGAALLRVEEDTNADGRVDKWEHYDGDRVSQASFDTTLSRGRPDRRVSYDVRGTVTSIEVDPEGDGTFVPAPIDAAPGSRPGVK